MGCIKMRLKSNLLEGRNFNITKQFSQIIQIFQDFKLVQQIREEVKILQSQATIN